VYLNDDTFNTDGNDADECSGDIGSDCGSDGGGLSFIAVLCSFIAPCVVSSKRCAVKRAPVPLQLRAPL
jgi:hypothetical protein